MNSGPVEAILKYCSQMSRMPVKKSDIIELLELESQALEKKFINELLYFHSFELHPFWVIACHRQSIYFHRL